MADTDVNGIENLLAVVYNANSSPKDRAYAQEILTKFQESPESWISVPAIIENSRNQETKFFALQVLDKVIEFRWKILPNEQRMGMRAYIVNKIVQLSSNEQIFRENKILIQKLNQTLVQILKQEWPNSWGSFIEDIVTSSKNNEVLCENNMNILKLLSEEIFDFSKNKMTLAKATNLKNEFRREFLLIYQLCEFSLKNAQKAELLQQTLRTILGFLNFIEQKYIFDTDLINFLVNKFLPNVKFRNGALRCLTEIVGLTKIDSNYQETLFAQLLTLVLQQLTSIVPPNIDLSAAYEKGSSSDKLFVNNLALFITVLFKNHARIFETDERYHPILIEAHKYLARITSVDEEEIFKICLEYWNGLAESLCHECYPKGGFFQVSAVSSSRKKLYSDPLQSVRISLISKMSKPEEVLIIEDENGEMIKEEFPDCNTIALYNMMRDTLVYLTHLDPNETIGIMREKLTKISQNRNWTRQELNSLCWAIGSISGSQSEDEEKRILVQIIKELLTLSEKERTKDNKAIVASNIMYIVGQYPRFLNNHWRFLHTVITKLFEFMKEDHPGIRDMACETFLKIAKACKQKFVITQPMASSPFIMNILDDLNQIIGPLEASQVAIFFEAVGYIIAAHNDLSVKRKLIFQLMAGANQKWDDVIQMASINLNVLFDDVKTAKLITSILNLNLKASQSLASWYLSQLERNFVTMMHIYRTFSTHISKIISLEGIQTKAPIRVFRAVKRETLRLLQNFIQNAKDFTFISQNVIPPLFDAILDDYLNSHPAARDPEVISLITITITQLKQNIVNEIPKIFFTVIQPTISMIQSNFEDFPDHRIYFFNLIQAINTHCFNAFFIIKPEQFKLAIDSIVWAFKHPIKNISDIGLLTLYQLWVNIQHSEIAPAFYQTFLLSLLNDLLTVLTDSFHKSGFKMQSGLLLLIISSVQSGKVTVPLWDTTNFNYANNQTFVGEYMVNLISSGLPNLSQGQVVSFVKGLFDHCNNLPEFKQHLRDFIVNMKEFADADNSELYREEQEAKEKEILSIKSAVPGLIKSTEALNLSL